MSDDEVFVLIGGAFISLFMWGKYYFNLFFTRPHGSKAGKFVLFILPFLSAAALFSVLTNFASFDVKDAPTYLYFYMVMGAAWTGLCQRWFHFLGVSVRDDVLERNNIAALWTVGGAMIGSTLCFAGANIGDGPGWWVVVFCGLLATSGLFLVWLFVERFNHLSDAITIDRDEASGFRLGGFLLAASLILGRGAAGNWVSTEEAVAVFIRTAWPCLILAVFAGLLDRLFRPTPQTPSHNFAAAGIFPAFAYIGSAVAYVISRGWW